MAGSAMVFGGTLTAAVVLFGVWQPQGWRGDTVVERVAFTRDATVGLLRERIIATVIPPAFRRAHGPGWSTWLNEEGLTTDFETRWTAATIAGLAFAFPAGIAVFFATRRRSAARHVAGPRLIANTAATRRASQASITMSGSTIDLAPGLPMAREREVRSMLILGAQRSGKTVVLRSLLRQLRTTDAKLVVHDTKGDMTATWPSDDFILLAPQDKRSWGWDIARDLRGEQDATEFATAVLPEGKEPMWAQGARQILVGLIKDLQFRQGSEWSWIDLSQALQLRPDRLFAAATNFHPQAAAFLAREPSGEFTKLAASYLTTLLAPLVAMIRPCAAAWSDLAPRYRLSLRDWMADDYTGPRTLILQRTPQFPELSRLWITAAINTMVAVSGGAEFPDSRERRIWFVLDEFPQLGKIKSLFEVPATHAAKGVTVALALQSLAQAKEAYGQDATALLSGLTGTKLVFRLQPGEDAEYASKQLVGTWRYRFRERTLRPRDQGWFPEASTVWREQEGVLLLPSYFAGLGAATDGVEGLAIGLDGGDVHRLSWPYENWPEQRQPGIPAEWTTAIQPLRNTAPKSA